MIDSTSNGSSVGQTENGDFPMNKTGPGITADVNETHPRKSWLPMDVIESGITIAANEEK